MFLIVDLQGKNLDLGSGMKKKPSKNDQLTGHFLKYLQNKHLK